MFKKMLKAIMLAQAASAARKTLRYLSDRDLDDMGLSRSTFVDGVVESVKACLLYTSPSPRDYAASRMPSSA